MSLMESQLAGLVNVASSALNAPPGTPPPKRWGTSHESIVPYQTFRCKSSEDGEDQFIVVGAGNDTQFASFSRALGKLELASDGRFETNAARVANRQELIPILEKIFMKKTRDEWFQLLDGRGFPVGPVRNVPEAFSCPQAVERGMVTEFDHPVAGKVRLPGHPIRYSRMANVESEHDVAVASLPPPMLGEHTEEVLRDILCIAPEERARLEREGIVECWMGVNSKN